MIKEYSVVCTLRDEALHKYLYIHLYCILCCEKISTCSSSRKQIILQNFKKIRSVVSSKNIPKAQKLKATDLHRLRQVPT